jgi:hypothetical protein
MKQLVSANSKWARLLANGTVIGALAWASFVVAPAYASPSRSAANLPFTVESQVPDGWLEKAYQRELAGLDVQQIHLNEANRLAGEIQAWIDMLNSHGVDTKLLTVALTTFQAQTAAAQTAHDGANNILTVHAGFDANGTVIDNAQALETVLSARRALLEAHQVLDQAVEDLQSAIRTFRATL